MSNYKLVTIDQRFIAETILRTGSDQLIQKASRGFVGLYEGETNWYIPLHGNINKKKPQNAFYLTPFQTSNPHFKRPGLDFQKALYVPESRTIEIENTMPIEQSKLIFSKTDEISRKFEEYVESISKLDPTLPAFAQSTIPLFPEGIQKILNLQKDQVLEEGTPISKFDNLEALLNQVFPDWLEDGVPIGPNDTLYAAKLSQKQLEDLFEKSTTVEEFVQEVEASAQFEKDWKESRDQAIAEQFDAMLEEKEERDLELSEAIGIDEATAKLKAEKPELTTESKWVVRLPRDLYYYGYIMESLPDLGIESGNILEEAKVFSNYAEAAEIAQAHHGEVTELDKNNEKNFQTTNLTEPADILLAEAGKSQINSTAMPTNYMTALDTIYPDSIIESSSDKGEWDANMYRIDILHYISPEVLQDIYQKSSSLDTFKTQVDQTYSGFQIAQEKKEEEFKRSLDAEYEAEMQKRYELDQEMNLADPGAWEDSPSYLAELQNSLELGDLNPRAIAFINAHNTVQSQIHYFLIENNKFGKNQILQKDYSGQPLTKELLEELRSLDHPQPLMPVSEMTLLEIKHGYIVDSSVVGIGYGDLRKSEFLDKDLYISSDKSWKEIDILIDNWEKGNNSEKSLDQFIYEAYQQDSSFSGGFKDWLLSKGATDLERFDIRDLQDQSQNLDDFSNIPEDDKRIKNDNLQPTQEKSLNDLIKDKDISGLSKHMKEGLSEFKNSDHYKEYLQAISRLPNYSSHNVRLLLAQKSDVQAVASFKQWKEKFDRTVNKGEKSLRIYAPSQYTLKDKNGQPQLDKNGEKIVKQTFVLVPVFDVSQTSGKEFPKFINELSGDVKGYENLFHSLSKTASVSIRFDDIPLDAHGYYSPTNKEIVLQKGMSEEQTIKTLIHEMTHSELHTNSNTKFGDADYRVQEFEAESVAYVVSNHYQIDSSDYSFGYLSNWGMDQESLKQLEDLMERVQEKSRDLISRVDGELSKLKENMIEKDPLLDKIEQAKIRQSELNTNVEEVQSQSKKLTGSLEI